jgi:uncharacterized Ntn-hydrolase superfamily protein
VGLGKGVDVESGVVGVGSVVDSLLTAGASVATTAVAVGWLALSSVKDGLAGSSVAFRQAANSTKIRRTKAILKVFTMDLLINR